MDEYDGYMYATVAYVNGQPNDSTVGLARLGYFGSGGESWRETDHEYTEKLMGIMTGMTICPSYAPRPGQVRKWVVETPSYWGQVGNCSYGRQTVRIAGRSTLPTVRERNTPSLTPRSQLPMPVRPRGERPGPSWPAGGSGRRRRPCRRR